MIFKRKKPLQIQYPVEKVPEYAKLRASLANYDLPNKRELISLVGNEIEGKSLEEIVWEEEGGKAKPLGFYYDNGWHKIDEYTGNEVVGVEIVRKAKNAVSGKTERDMIDEYWRVRKVKFIRKDGKMVPIGNWREYPTDVTRIVRETVKEVYDELIKEYPFFEITLFGSAANGSMKNGSDVEYSIIIDYDKMINSKKYKELGGRNDNSYESYKARSTIEYDIKKKFNDGLINALKGKGINIAIGYSYIAYRENGKINDPDGVSKNEHWRVLYTPSGVRFVKYNEFLK